MEAGLKDLGEKMTNMETKVSEKLAVLEKKVNYVMRYVPPMDEDTGMEKQVSIGGEPSSEKENEVGSALEEENEVGTGLEKENGPLNTRSRKYTSS
ncbi:unnamed protein product [Arabis nemorensis]|uniref:Uncharacterized protein n=1 Tax=Arabis nemorensis TaxID=586526 RepID=A0A565CL65_9BRAS|nr:unnamed protein product [Arabis nemorensis]